MPSPITTHILDTARGVPAVGVAVALERQEADGNWHSLGQGTTNDNGRITDLLPDDAPVPSGLYRLTFQTGDYLTALGVVSKFFPVVRIEFAIADSNRSHWHVPLLLSPFSYSTYLGS